MSFHSLYDAALRSHTAHHDGDDEVEAGGGAVAMSRAALTCVFYMSRTHEKKTTQDGRWHERTPTPNAHISLACKQFSSSYSRPRTYRSAFPSCLRCWHLLDESHSGTDTQTWRGIERERERERERESKMRLSPHGAHAHAHSTRRRGTWGV